MPSELTQAMSGQTDLYMDLLIAQLKNQDPEQPMSNGEMVTQLAQLSTLDALNDLKLTFSQMLELQQFGNGAELIGSEIEYGTDGQLVRSTVDSLTVSNDTVRLVLANGAQASLGDVTRIFGPQESGS
jgi:flagellar basal-body rod modification protein FlgD